MFHEETYTSALWGIPTCSDLLSHNSFLLLQVFKAGCYQKLFLGKNLRIVCMALSRRCRQVLQQHREQELTGVTPVKPLSLVPAYWWGITCATWKKCVHEWYLRLGKAKNLSRECLVFHFRCIKPEKLPEETRRGQWAHRILLIARKAQVTEWYAIFFLFHQEKNIYLHHHWFWRSCSSEVKYYHIAPNRSKGLSKQSKGFLIHLAKIKTSSELLLRISSCAKWKNVFNWKNSQN